MHTTLPDPYESVSIDTFELKRLRACEKAWFAVFDQVRKTRETRETTNRQYSGLEITLEEIKRLQALTVNPKLETLKPNPQDALMLYDPATCEKNPYPSHAAQWRKFNATRAWLYNPWTGYNRSAEAIGNDVFGLLIKP